MFQPKSELVFTAIEIAIRQRKNIHHIDLLINFSGTFYEKTMQVFLQRLCTHSVLILVFVYFKVIFNTLGTYKLNVFTSSTDGLFEIPTCICKKHGESIPGLKCNQYHDQVSFSDLWQRRKKC